MDTPAQLPDDINALKAIILTQRDQNARLEALVKAFKKALFGAKSERIDLEQYELSLEVRDRFPPLSLGPMARQWQPRQGQKGILLGACAR